MFYDKFKVALPFNGVQVQSNSNKIRCNLYCYSWQYVPTKFVPTELFIICKFTTFHK